MKNLTKISRLNKSQIQELIDQALLIKKDLKAFQDQLKDKLIAVIFFEASTRTRLSFEAAINRLGARSIGFADAKASSYGKKGESLEDTIKVVSNYADLIVMRHPEEGAAEKAEQVSKVPIINAGDGSNEHPTQTLLDLMTIYETQGDLNHLTIGMVGDLKYGRTVRSLSKALINFKGNKLYYISPQALKMRQDIKQKIKNKIQYIESESLEENISLFDILYMTRIQKERFKDLKEYQKYFGQYILKQSNLVKVKNNLKILHPLPRINEIETEIDQTRYAYYLEQAENGMYMRMAILLKMLGKL
jgi:aspartate carbamoyltransferase catalytic subunit